MKYACVVGGYYYYYYLTIIIVVTIIVVTIIVITMTLIIAVILGVNLGVILVVIDCKIVTIVADKDNTLSSCNKSNYKSRVDVLSTNSAFFIEVIFLKKACVIYSHFAVNL